VSGLERERAVKVRHLVASAMVAAMAIAATGCQKDSSQQADEPKELVVWLMKGSAPPPVIDAVNKEFEEAHKGTKVKIELQEWPDIGTKTTAALADNTPPDVLEIGNTLTAGFADAGGLKDLTNKKSDLGGGDWNKGLEESGTVNGKLYGVPYYAGTRVVLYRKDLWTAAGITTPPTTIDELITAGQKLQAKNAATKDFSGFYVPGKYWYMGVSFVHGYGGKLATQDGDKWKGALDSAESVKGLEAYKNFADKLSKAPKDATEADPPQINALASGKAAAIYDAGWQIAEIEKANPKLKGQIGTFALPGPTADSAMPAFLGGSNLAIAANSKSPNNAYDWLKLLATKYQSELVSQGKVIPNSNTLLQTAAQDPAIKPSADAAKNGWFVPSSPKWVEVENSSVLMDLFVNLFTGKKSPQDAGKAASDVITETLNK
jgi:N,N'-diacetylchitobiose transport system substrate-binding protein